MHIDSGDVRYWPRMSRDALTRLFPDGKTVFIPSDGQPMPGYDQARAEIEARGGEVQVAHADNASAGGGGLFSWLFGARAGGADDEEEASGVEATPTGRGGRVSASAPAQVASADAPREAPASAAAPQPTPTPTPPRRATALTRRGRSERRRFPRAAAAAQAG